MERERGEKGGHCFWVAIANLTVATSKVSQRGKQRGAQEKEAGGDRRWGGWSFLFSLFFFSLLGFTRWFLALPSSFLARLFLLIYSPSLFFVIGISFTGKEGTKMAARNEHFRSIQGQ